MLWTRLALGPTTSPGGPQGLTERWAERDSAPGCPQTVRLNGGSHLDVAETESCQGEEVAGKD